MTNKLSKNEIHYLEALLDKDELHHESKPILRNKLKRQLKKVS